MLRMTVAVFLLTILAGPFTPAAAQETHPEPVKKLVEPVTTDEVKRFLDPTRMISKLEYKFQMNYLPSDINLATHKFRPWIALHNRHAVWAEVPLLNYNDALPGGPAGLGDIKAGWGFLAYENLSRRLTAVVGAVEVQFPTGDPDQALGLDKTTISPVAAVVWNPTDMFPVYFYARYFHSIDAGGSAENPGEDLRALRFRLQTFHILPHGFFLAFIPVYVFDLNKDSDILSFSIGAGKVLNRRLSLQGGYVQHISGKKTFNRGFTLGLSWLWGSEQTRH